MPGRPRRLGTTPILLYEYSPPVDAVLPVGSCRLLLVVTDDKHSQQETRYHALGITDDSRFLSRKQFIAN